MRAAAYARYSSDNQREESIDAQLRAIREFAQREGHEVVVQYTDEAKSATTDQRPGFQRLIADAEAHLFDAVIVHKLDRFSRDKYDSAIYKRRLKRAGTRLMSVLERLDDSPEAVILESVLEGMAEYYSRNLSRETKKGLKENALSGRITGGNPPIGYRLDNEKRYIIDEQEAHWIRVIFEMYANGASYQDVIDELTRIGAITRTNKPFRKNSIHDILINDKYIGILHLGRWERNKNGSRTRKERPDDEHIIIFDKVPPIIEEMTWAQVQDRMRNNKHASKPKHSTTTYPLGGLVRCGLCGMPMTGKTVKLKSGNLHIGYYCQGKVKKVNDCKMGGVAAYKIEEPLIEELKKALSIKKEEIEELIIRKINKQRDNERDPHVEFQARLGKLDAQISAAVDAVLSGMNSPALAERLKTLEAQRQDLLVQIATEDKKSWIGEVSPDALARDIYDKYQENLRSLESGDEQALKEVLRIFVQKVIIRIDHFNVWYKDADDSTVVLLAPPTTIHQYYCTKPGIEKY